VETVLKFVFSVLGWRNHAGHEQFNQGHKFLLSTEKIIFTRTSFFERVIDNDHTCSRCTAKTYYFPSRIPYGLAVVSDN